VLPPAQTFEWLPTQRECRAADVPRHRAAGF
jgi:hypothetical protein